jgi:hypothetical protein
MKRVLAVKFPIVQHRRVGLGIHPASLVETHHLNARLAQAPGEGSSRGTGANDQDIHTLGLLCHDGLLEDETLAR